MARAPCGPDGLSLHVMALVLACKGSELLSLRANSGGARHRYGVIRRSSTQRPAAAWASCSDPCLLGAVVATILPLPDHGGVNFFMFGVNPHLRMN